MVWILWCCIWVSKPMICGKETWQQGVGFKLRAGLHHGPWSHTMEDGPFPWSNFHGPIPWEINLQTLLGPSLGVNYMWAERNNHTPKSECANFFNICPKRVVFQKNDIKFDYLLCCLLLSSPSLPTPKRNREIKNKNHNFFIIWAFIFHGPLHFSNIAPFFASPTTKPVE